MNLIWCAATRAHRLSKYDSSLLVLCFAEASSYFDRPGSAYLYARTAFGDLVGFEVGWMTWLARVASVASLSVGFAQALSYLWPTVLEGWGKSAAIGLPLLGLTLLNVVGVRSGVRAAVFLVITKILPLLLFVGAGVFVATWDGIAQQPAGSGEFGRAALLLLFAFAGTFTLASGQGDYPRQRSPTTP